jgi:hypothetical protein
VVEVPESIQSSHQNWAIRAARNVGGAELRNDMNFAHGSWAKLFLVDPTKLDFKSCVVSDGCKVWIVQRPNGFEANG